MLRLYPSNAIELSVSRCQIVNDGIPFLRIMCENIRVSPEQRRILSGNNAWNLDGAGGPIKQFRPGQFLNRHHMPGSGTDPDGNTLTGVGHFTVDFVVDLYMPRGVLDIQFAKYSDQRETFERAKKAEDEKKRKAEESKNEALQKQRKKEEEIASVDGFRRKFKNLDLEE